MRHYGDNKHMNDKTLQRKSKYLSLILRHKPEVAGIALDKYGWAPVNDIVKALDIDLETLKCIVRTDSKQRYSFNEDQTKIRANQGHSIKVDVGLKEATPPDILYHGTGTKSLSGIAKTGITKQSRQYVHLSKDTDTAMKVGMRHGNPIILVIDCKEMLKDGYKFYLSENGVWLTDIVPIKYIINFR